MSAFLGSGDDRRAGALGGGAGAALFKRGADSAGSLGAQPSPILRPYFVQAVATLTGGSAIGTGGAVERERLTRNQVAR